jgi:hypothetical protein
MSHPTGCVANLGLDLPSYLTFKAEICRDDRDPPAGSTSVASRVTGTTISSMPTLVAGTGSASVA